MTTAHPAPDADSPQTGFAAVNATTLYYEVVGRGRPVVFLHGFALDQRMWADQAAALAPHCQVIGYDLRGFGRSALPTGAPYSHTADLRALLDVLGLAQVTVVGLSRGGRWALQFALDHPERVAALVVADAMPHGFQAEAQGPAQAPQVRAAAAQCPAAARRAWFNQPLFAPARAQPRVGERLWQMIADYSGWHWYHADPVCVSQPPAVDRLGQVQAPTLVMVGEADLPVYQQAASTLRQAIPRAQMVRVRRAGHLSNLENPGEFNSALRRFLEE